MRVRATTFLNTALFGAVFVVALDRLAKAVALTIWKTQPLVIIDRWLSLNFSKNIFVAFSLPTFFNPIIIAGIVIVVLMAYTAKTIAARQWLETAALGWIIAGALSNLYDRLNYGYVIDYIDLSYFTVFNVADSMICLGVAVLMWRQLFSSSR